MDGLIPKPQSITRAGGAFVFGSGAAIVLEPATPPVRAVAQQLSELLHAATGAAVPIVEGKEPQPGQITLQLLPDAARDTGQELALGAEGYRLKITPAALRIEAQQLAGFFYALQTLRQLLPPPGQSTESLQLPAGEIVDFPRFGWRGAMLDVARHFFAVEDVKRYIDLLAFYKFNRLHLHLTDDQGWRIEIKSWPQLTLTGGASAVNGDKGGHYSQEDYVELVAYAAERFITIVPEIDLPSHTNAALAAYAELNCDGQAPPPYTGTEVGFSSLCVDKEITYQFLDDVLRELAALTPGPYLHIGGDEAHSTPPAAYARFMQRVQPLVEKYGKQVVGWEELGQVALLPGTLVQQWNTDPARIAHTLQAVEQGAQVIMSPAARAYLDMKYNADTALGLQWAGLVSVRDAYTWDPATFLAGVDAGHVAGIEAPIWSETLRTLEDVTYMALPRLAGIGEIGWSAQEGRSWEEYHTRLATHAPYWEALGLRYYRSPEVNWP